MGTILNLLRKVEAVDTDSICVQSLEDTKDQIEVKNRERMNEGIRSDGSVMPNYSYISQKVYGYPNEPIKLKATGAFQAAIKVTVTPEMVNTDSTDSKSDMLQARYGSKIFGLDAESKKEFIKESLRPVFINKMKQATGL